MYYCGRSLEFIDTIDHSLQSESKKMFNARKRQRGNGFSENNARGPRRSSGVSFRVTKKPTDTLSRLRTGRTPRSDVRPTKP